MNATRLLALCVVLCGAALLLWFVLEKSELETPRALTVQKGEQAAIAPGPKGERATLPIRPELEPDAAQPENTPVASAPTRERVPEKSKAKPKKAGPRYRGRVVSHRGLAIEDAVVTIGAPRNSGMMNMQVGKQKSDASSNTAADGSFSLPRKKKREVLWVEVRARGFCVYSETHPIDGPPADFELGQLVLEPGAILAGQVVDASGAPVAGAGVRRKSTEPGFGDVLASALAEEMGSLVKREEILTDEEGRFELASEDPGEFTLIAQHERYPETRIEGETVAGESLTLLLRFPPSASIAGRLIDFPAGREGVKVKARALELVEDPERPEIDLAALFESAGLGSADRSAEVDPDGKFELTGLHPDARYELTASQSLGFMQRERCSERKEFRAGEQGVELGYDAGSSVAFQLVDSESGKAVKDISVRHAWIGDGERGNGMAAMGGGSKPKVSSSGAVRIEELRPPEDPGTLRLVVRAPGYRDHEIEELLVPGGAELDLGTIGMQAATRVRVRVVDSRTGDPIRRARVRLAEDRPDMFAAAMAANRRNAKGEQGASAEIEEFDSLRPPHVMKGKTDADGVCELAGFYAKGAILEVKASKYSDYRRTGLVLMSTGVHEELVQLLPGGTVVVRVVDVFDQPVPRARIERRDPTAEGSGGRTSKKTGKDGFARFEHLLAGEHLFRIAPERGGDFNQAFRASLLEEGEEEDEELWSRVSVGDGLEETLVLQQATRATLEGRISVRGRPLAGATITLHVAEDIEAGDEAMRELQSQLTGMGQSSIWSDDTDEDGRFALDDIPARSYLLRVSHPDRRVSDRIELELRPGFNEYDWDLPTTAIEGRVVDQTGAPIAHARVTVDRGGEEGDEVRQIRAFMESAGMKRGSSEDVYTNAHGEFVLDGLPAGVELVVNAAHEQFSAASSAGVTLAADELRSGVVVTLTAAGSLLISAPEAEGVFRMITASYVAPKGEESQVSPKMSMLRQGRAVLRGLKPGSWRVQVQGSTGGEEAEQLVEIHAGRQASITL